MKQCPGNYTTDTQICDLCFGGLNYNCPIGYFKTGTACVNTTKVDTQTCITCGYGVTYTCPVGWYRTGMVCVGSTSTDTQTCVPCNNGNSSYKCEDDGAYKTGIPCVGTRNTDTQTCMETSTLTTTETSTLTTTLTTTTEASVSSNALIYSTPAFYGIVTGACIFLILIVLIIVYYYRRKHATQRAPSPPSPFTGTTASPLLLPAVYEKLTGGFENITPPITLWDTGNYTVTSHAIKFVIPNENNISIIGQPREFDRPFAGTTVSPLLQLTGGFENITPPITLWDTAGYYTATSHAIKFVIPNENNISIIRQPREFESFFEAAAVYTKTIPRKMTTIEVENRFGPPSNGTTSMRGRLCTSWERNEDPRTLIATHRVAKKDVLVPVDEDPYYSLGTAGKSVIAEVKYENVHVSALYPYSCTTANSGGFYFENLNDDAENL